MSWLALEWAEEAPVASVYERVILMALAYRANSDGTNAYPARSRMARSATCDVKTVQRHLNGLLARRVIARGDQAAARHIRPDNRPVVYDLLIPYSWYSHEQLTKVNRNRHERGLPPLRPEDRPDLAPPPEKPGRSDKGKARRPKNPASGPPDGDGPGGLTVPPPDPVDNRLRRDSESGAGGLSVPYAGTLSPQRQDSETPEPLRDQPVLESGQRPHPPHLPNAGAGALPDRRDGGEGASEDEQSQDRAKLAVKLLRTILDELGSKFAEPSPHDKLELVRLVVAVWARRASSAIIRETLSTGLTGVQDIGKVWITRLTRLAAQLEHDPAPTLPAVCGRCDARPGEGVHARIVWVDVAQDLSRPCPNCHPAGIAAAATALVTGKTA